MDSVILINALCDKLDSVRDKHEHREDVDHLSYVIGYTEAIKDALKMIGKSCQEKK